MRAVPAMMCSCGDRTVTVALEIIDETVIGDPDATFTAWMCEPCAERLDPTGEHRAAGYREG